MSPGLILQFIGGVLSIIGIILGLIGLFLSPKGENVINYFQETKQEIKIDEHNEATSYGQQGGITAGKIEVNNLDNTNPMVLVDKELHVREYGYQVFLYFEPTNLDNPSGQFKLEAKLTEKSIGKIHAGPLISGTQEKWLSPDKMSAYVKFTPTGRTKVWFQVTDGVEVRFQGNQDLESFLLKIPSDF